MEPTAHEASEEAVHKAKSAQAAVELAREIQQNELVEKTAQKTKEALLEGLKEVFKEGDGESDTMIVRWKRIPFLCKSVEEMHASLTTLGEDVKDLKDTQKWGTRIVVGAVIASVLKLVLFP